jgi:ABC-2 type transport system permease protein
MGSATMVGTGSLIRLILRRDRLRLAVWVILLSAVPLGTASAFIELYPDAVSREQLAATVTSSPSLVAVLGPLYDSSIGGLVTWRVGVIAAFLIGLMAVLTVIRHTREEEETGRRELLGATVLGRNAPLAAALIAAMGTGLLIGLILTTGFIGMGLPSAGSVAFGLGMAGVAAVFAGVGAVAAQLTENASTAKTIGVAALGVAYLLRIAGDMGESSGALWLSWLSPIGWFTQLRPYAGERWWVLALLAGLVVILVVAAAALAAGRDVGAGALPTRTGPAEAGPGLRTAAGLGWRMQRGALLGWAAGLGVLGMVYGGAANSINDMLVNNPQLAEIFELMGGEQGLIDTYFSFVVGVIALLAAAYAIRSVLRLRTEEDRVRAEPILATATPRSRWAWSHLVYGLAGPVLVLVLAGVMAGLVYGLISGDVAEQVPRVLGAAMVQLPAVWVITGLAMALYGLAPDYVGLSWGALIACLVVTWLGQILQFPQWTLNLSPFTHVPLFPAQDIEVVPLLVLAAIAVVLLGAGLVGFRRRDIG